MSISGDAIVTVSYSPDPGQPILRMFDRGPRSMRLDVFCGMYRACSHKEPWRIRALTGDDMHQYPVLDVLDNGDRDVVTLRTAAGHQLTLTDDHKVLADVFTPVRDLTAENHLASDAPDWPTGVRWVDFLSASPASTARVYDVVCAEPYRNFVAGGIVVHV